MFIGYVELEETLNAPVLILDSARTPVNTDALPTIRVYGPQGLIPASTGVGDFLDEGTITSATHAAPIVITSLNHKLTTGTYVTISGVMGNLAANGSWPISFIDADTFSLDGSSGDGDYTLGGVWNVSGLYVYSVSCTSANGFESGTTYYVLIQGRVAGVSTADTETFIVT